jgi:flagellar basal-body rod protein FlgB
MGVHYTLRHGQLCGACQDFDARKAGSPLKTKAIAVAGNLRLPAVMLDPIAGVLERYLDVLSLRQKLVASNIANADTPGFKTRDIDFQAEFRNLVKGGSPNVVEVGGLPGKNDGNNVSVDREARLLAENALRFNLATNLLRARIQAVRSAIQEGRNG